MGSTAHGRTELANGVPIHFEIYGAGEPLLLRHGFTGTGQDWMPSAEAWGPGFQLIVPDLRGHGRSGILAGPFRHRDAAADMLALFDRLALNSCRGVGVSGGGNALLHMAVLQPERVNAMVLVSATPYFPDQARAFMRQYRDSLTAGQREALVRRHPGGESQVDALLAAASAFAASYDDMNLTASDLSRIRARTLIVQGDRDPLYPIELSVEMAKAIPQSSLWIVEGGGHGPVAGSRWPEFVTRSREFLAAS